MTGEASLRWRKSSYSGSQSDCVEVALTNDALVRDSKNTDGAILTFTPSAFAGFLSAATSGQLRHN